LCEIDQIHVEFGKFEQLLVQSTCGNSDNFDVEVGMHQGLALSPLLFVMVVDAVSRKFRNSLQWELLYADDLVAIAEIEEEMIKKHQGRVEWKEGYESKCE